MNRIYFIAILASLLTICCPAINKAATVWSGPDITVTQPGGSPLSVSDVLVPGFHSLARGEIGPLCDQLAGDNCDSDDLNPSSIRFAFSGASINPVFPYGSAPDHGLLFFDHMADALNGSIGITIVGRPGVAHILGDDIYFDIEFSSWTSGDGGFSYRRSTAIPEPASALLVTLCGLAMLKSRYRS